MDANTIVFAIIILAAILLVGGFIILVLLFNLKAGKHQQTQTNNITAKLTTKPPNAASDAAPPEFVALPQTETGQQVKHNSRLPFSIKQVWFPFSIFAASCLIVLIFMPLLSGEMAFRFDTDGNPANWANTWVVVGVGLGLQSLLFIAGWFNGYTMNRVAYSNTATIEQSTKPRQVALVSANMVALPQIIIAFLMANMFTYNVSEIHLMPIWLFVISVLLAGGAVIIYKFIKIMKIEK